MYDGLWKLTDNAVDKAVLLSCFVLIRVHEGKKFADEESIYMKVNMSWLFFILFLDSMQLFYLLIDIVCFCVCWFVWCGWDKWIGNVVILLKYQNYQRTLFPNCRMIYLIRMNFHAYKIYTIILYDNYAQQEDAQRCAKIFRVCEKKYPWKFIRMVYFVDVRAEY